MAEVTRAPDGRVEGRIHPDASVPWRTFSGFLELLKVLEELLDHDELESARSDIRKETT
jgi:hypothetical protein